MFDIGMLELGLIAVVALLVIGPERLPAVARTIGFWFGKTRKFVTSVQEDFNREVIKSEELKRLVEEQSNIKDVHEIIEHTLDESRKTVSTSANLETKKKQTPQLDEVDSESVEIKSDSKGLDQAQKIDQEAEQAPEPPLEQVKSNKPEQAKN
ncbi:Sec-independent protein translocase protein TatB [Kaarinaea lacus]